MSSSCCWPDMVHPCPECGRPVRIRNASRLADERGILYCTRCARLIEKNQHQVEVEARSRVLSQEEYSKLEQDALLSSALAETWKDFEGGQYPAFETLTAAGRDSEEERRRVVQLVHTRAFRKAERERAVWVILAVVIVISSVGIGFISVAGGVIWFVSMLVIVYLARAIEEPHTRPRRIQEDAQTWLMSTDVDSQGEDSERALGRTLNRASAREHFAGLSPKEFEEAVGKIFTSYGYETEVTPYVRDRGVDLFLNDKEGTRSVVQVKQYTSGLSVGRPDLQKLQGAMLDANTDRAIFVTLSNFSEPARRYARQHGLRLIDGDDLVDMWLEGQSGLSEGGE